MTTITSDLRGQVSAALRDMVGALDANGLGQEAALHIVFAADLLDEERARDGGRLPSCVTRVGDGGDVPWQLRPRP